MISDISINHLGQISSGNSSVSFFVEAENASSERRFEKSLTIHQLKVRLGPITGVPIPTMKVVLQIKKGESVTKIPLLDDNAFLGSYPVEDYQVLQVVDTNPHRIKNEFNDLSRVQKYEMKDEEYQKRTDSVRAYKERNKIGRVADTPQEQIDRLKTYEEAAKKIQVNDRCQVTNEGMEKRGTVRFVGEAKFKPGYWIGVELDEPLGKNNGSVDGVRYFECGNKYGAFFRPNLVTIGDFPVEEFDLDEL